MVVNFLRGITNLGFFMACFLKRNFVLLAAVFFLTVNTTSKAAEQKPVQQNKETKYQRNARIQAQLSAMKERMHQAKSTTDTANTTEAAAAAQEPAPSTAAILTRAIKSELSVSSIFTGAEAKEQRGDCEQIELDFEGAQEEPPLTEEASLEERLRDRYLPDHTVFKAFMSYFIQKAATTHGEDRALDIRENLAAAYLITRAMRCDGHSCFKDIFSPEAQRLGFFANTFPQKRAYTANGARPGYYYNLRFIKISAFHEEGYITVTFHVELTKVTPGGLDSTSKTFSYIDHIEEPTRPVDGAESQGPA